MREVLTGHPIRCVNAFRMELHLFSRLCEELSIKYGLKSSQKTSIIEKVGIFLYTVATGVSNRIVMERFQRSGDTISRVFHEVLNAITNRKTTCLAHDIIRPQDPNFREIPSRIANDEIYMPYFKVIILVYGNKFYYFLAYGFYTYMLSSYIIFLIGLYWMH